MTQAKLEPTAIINAYFTVARKAAQIMDLLVFKQSLKVTFLVQIETLLGKVELEVERHARIDSSAASVCPTAIIYAYFITARLVAFLDQIETLLGGVGTAKPCFFTSFAAVHKTRLNILLFSRSLHLCAQLIEKWPKEVFNNLKRLCTVLEKEEVS